MLKLHLNQDDMKKHKRTNKGLKPKLNSNEALLKAVKLAYENKVDNSFYTAITLSEKSIMDVKPDGNIYKAVLFEGESKILAELKMQFIISLQL